jgi:hypothetical protein
MTPRPARGDCSHPSGLSFSTTVVACDNDVDCPVSAWWAIVTGSALFSTSTELATCDGGRALT